jgi:hypothetical protein
MSVELLPKVMKANEVSGPFLRPSSRQRSLVIPAVREYYAESPEKASQNLIPLRTLHARKSRQRDTKPDAIENLTF